MQEPSYVVAGPLRLGKLATGITNSYAIKVLTGIARQTLTVNFSISPCPPLLSVLHHV